MSITRPLHFAAETGRSYVDLNKVAVTLIKLRVKGLMLSLASLIIHRRYHSFSVSAENELERSMGSANGHLTHTQQRVGYLRVR